MKLHSLQGGDEGPAFTSQLMLREPSWEIRQILGPEGDPAGDLIVLYTPALVRAVVILRSVPPESEWDRLDTWVLAQIDNTERRYVVDYYEGRCVTGVEGPPEGEEGVDEEGVDEEETWD